MTMTMARGGSKGKVLMIVFHSISAYLPVTLFTLSLFIIPTNNSCSSVSVTRLQVYTDLQYSLNLIDDITAEEFFEEDCLINKEDTTEAETEKYDGSENRDKWIDSMDGHLTTSDIDHLRIVLNNDETALSNRPVLQSAYLSTLSDPKEIKDKCSAVMGDIFHAMDCIDIPHGHEAKKRIFDCIKGSIFHLEPIKVKGVRTINDQAWANIGEYMSWRII